MALWLSLPARANASLIISTVPIGNAGNTPDPTSGRGAVSYSYEMGTTEVTNTQYIEFLNAVAATDPYQLYHSEMSGNYGGITRLGLSGSYSYTTINGRENWPVIRTSLYSAMRFANWLQNGQPTGPQGPGTTETGAYTLATGYSVVRNVDWQWAIPTENEWYKAAYHQPATLGGDTDNYWRYPNSKNSITSLEANYGDSGFLRPIPVGSYLSNFYGTYDMGGNAWEVTETIIPDGRRQFRGGGFGSVVSTMSSGYTLYYDHPSTSHIKLGFRVIRIPEPSPVIILAVFGAACRSSSGVRRRRFWWRM